MSKNAIKKIATNEVPAVFAELQRAAVVAEILLAKGRKDMAPHALSVVAKNVTEILEFIKSSITKEIDMAGKGKKSGKKNFTTKQVPGGTKTPKTNQGVKPNPEAGSTGDTK